ncbi:MAG: carbohydrate kinase family protein [Pirellulales bacterium]|nr:carbohydrate kinase family protein [Pirellulales bacterium]
MNELDVDVAVAGHLCLDLIPRIDLDAKGDAGAMRELAAPGRLTLVGPATASLGGAVANAGLALARLGMRTSLTAKVGRDVLGQAILHLLEEARPGLAGAMLVDPRASTSYTVVLNPPGVDRCFLHHPGANDELAADDVDLAARGACGALHFGYPPLMRTIYADGGAGLARLFRRAQAAGTLTSLDMALPDRNSPAGRLDWRPWLATVLPAVDLFVPSFDEILLMLRPDQYDRLVAVEPDRLVAAAGMALVDEIAEELLALGAGAAGIKLGDEGFFLRTHAGPQRWNDRLLGRRLPLADWSHRRLLAPCFEVEVVGATGAGDCTIAGLLAALVHGQAPVAALTTAAGVGAFCVQSADATSNIPPWETVAARIAAGWRRRTPRLPRPGWRDDPATGLCIGPHDGAA